MPTSGSEKAGGNVEAPSHIGEVGAGTMQAGLLKIHQFALRKRERAYSGDPAE